MSNIKALPMGKEVLHLYRYGPTLVPNWVNTNRQFNYAAQRQDGWTKFVVQFLRDRKSKVSATHFFQRGIWVETACKRGPTFTINSSTCWSAIRKRYSRLLEGAWEYSVLCFLKADQMEGKHWIFDHRYFTDRSKTVPSKTGLWYRYRTSFETSGMR